MLEVIRKAMVIKEKSSNVPEGSVGWHYMIGQVQVLEHIIDNSLVPEEMKQTMMEMYEVAVRKYKEGETDKSISAEIRSELIAAADIIAWLLDIPHDVHQMIRQNIEKFD